MGAWRTVEHPGAERRLSLRRYVCLTYHCAITGAHRDRGRTLSMMLDSGLRWQHMSSDVNAVVRNCWVCRMIKNSLL
eukprot:3601093-Pyramimonas_sp.AAC.1